MAPIDELDSYADRRERKAWAAIRSLLLVTSAALSFLLLWLAYEAVSWIARGL